MTVAVLARGPCVNGPAQEHEPWRESDQYSLTATRAKQDRSAVKMAHMPEPKPIRSFYDIEGWFHWLDKTIFDELLQFQSDSPPGDLVELGAYKGKSTVVIGDHLRDGERFVVVDLFGEDASDSGLAKANRKEIQNSYATLTRQQFESNYLALHPVLPLVVQGLSSEIVDHVDPGTARFVHVDASHLYTHVREDVVSAKQLLRADGIVVFDDFRSEHTPGVAAAVWEAVVQGGLIPFAITPHKLYGVYGDPEPYASALRKLFTSDKRYWCEELEVLGRALLRARAVDPKQAPKPQSALTTNDLSRLADEVVNRIESSLSGQIGKLRSDSRAELMSKPAVQSPPRGRRWLRRLAHHALPPAVTGWIAKQRQRG